MHWQIHKGGNSVSGMRNARTTAGRRHAAYPTPLAIDAGIKPRYLDEISRQKDMFRLVSGCRSEYLRGYKR